MDRFGPEISDVVVDYDAVTLERRDVTPGAALARLTDRRARRVVTDLGACETAHDRTSREALLDRHQVDGALLRSHLELQRLQEEFHVGDTMRAVLAPMLAYLRTVIPPPIRVVDLGCGLGFMLRWLSMRGGLSPDVELIGVDYNRTLVAAAQRLSDEEKLSCRFVAANAFALREPAHVLISTGVLHHFRGDDLVAVFAEHERGSVQAFIHMDIRPSCIAPLGSWIFHQARMREPLAKYDGYWSAVRAHDERTLRTAIATGAPSFTLAMLDAHPGLRAVLRIFMTSIGWRGDVDLRAMYETFGDRIE